MVTNYEMQAESDFVKEGLRQLQHEAFASDTIQGQDEVVVVLSILGSTLHRYQTIPQPVPGGPSVHVPFSEVALDSWAEELKKRSYVPGVGTWTNIEVHLHRNEEGRIKIFDDNESAGSIESEPGLSLEECLLELAAFPRTADRIPAWMWKMFNEADAQPPVYNPDLQCVEWKNRRRPVSERGTDLSVPSTVIDGPLEPGVFAKIGKKLFRS
jgi:hypothetical protein